MTVVRVSVVAIPAKDHDNSIENAGLRSNLAAVIREAVNEVEEAYGDDAHFAVMVEAVSDR